jgi:hypothetical protein
MIAAKVVMEARAAGIQIEAQGDDLLLKAPAAPSPTMLALLSQNKCEILFWLRSKESGWSAEDWHAYFDERAAIAEFDGGLTRRQADERAFSCCVSEWLNRNPVSSSPNKCPGCKGDEQPHNPLLPFGAEPPGNAWLHSSCWQGWYEDRQAQAEVALRKITIFNNKAQPISKNG